MNQSAIPGSWQIFSHLTMAKGLGCSSPLMDYDYETKSSYGSRSS